MASQGPTGSPSADEALDAFARQDYPGAPLTAEEVAGELGCAPRAARATLRALADRGDLASREIDSGRRVWWRPSGAVTDELDDDGSDARAATTGAAHLEGVFRRTVGEVARAESRTALEEHVCDELVDGDRNLFAVSGEFSASFEEFSRRAWAGVDEEYLDVILHPREGPAFADGLGARAARTGEVQTERHVDGTEYEFWRDEADRRGFESYATVPFVYEGRVYGILGVFADRPDAFGSAERSLLSDLGGLVGCAVHGLVREEVREHALELEFRSEAIARPFVEASGGDVEITVDSILPLPDGNDLQYWTVTGIAPADCIDVVEEVATAENVEFLSRNGDAFRLEVHGTPNSASAALRRHDGRVKSVTIDGSALTVVAEVPASSDVEAVAEEIRRAYPTLELVAERSVLTRTWLRRSVEGELTDRQLTALHAAYSAGYFERPRHSTGDDIAERLGITRQTFNRHLRKAENRVYRLLFEDPDDAAHPHGD